MIIWEKVNRHYTVLSLKQLRPVAHELHCSLLCGLATHKKVCFHIPIHIYTTVHIVHIYSYCCLCCTYLPYSVYTNPDFYSVYHAYYKHYSLLHQWHLTNNSHPHTLKCSSNKETALTFHKLTIKLCCCNATLCELWNKILSRDFTRSQLCNCNIPDTYISVPRQQVRKDIYRVIFGHALPRAPHTQSRRSKFKEPLRLLAYKRCPSGKKHTAFPQPWKWALPWG